jgi:pyruvate kinase
VVFTRSGRTARLLSDERPRPPVLALSPSADVVSQLAIYWGIVPRKVSEVRSAEELLALGERRLVELGLARSGDTIVYVLGTNRSGAASNVVELAKVGAASTLARDK